MPSFFLVLIIAFTLVVIIIIFFTRRVADLTLTDQFRAAESISNGQFPDKWFIQIKQFLMLRSMIPIPQSGSPGTKKAVEKIEGLIRFFEKSPFFETEEARELLLKQLKDTRQHWLNMTWNEIEKAYKYEKGL